MVTSCNKSSLTVFPDVTTPKRRSPHQHCVKTLKVLLPSSGVCQQVCTMTYGSK